MEDRNLNRETLFCLRGTTLLPKQQIAYFWITAVDVYGHSLFPLLESVRIQQLLMFAMH